MQEKFDAAPREGVVVLDFPKTFSNYPHQSTQKARLPQSASRLLTNQTIRNNGSY